MVKKTCKQCGKEFVLSNSEIKFFKEKNLDLPKRCNECRKENKKNNNINNNTENNYKDNNTNNNYKDNNRNNNYKSNHNSGKKRTTLGSIIATGLVLIFLVVGKLFNLTPDLGYSDKPVENGQNKVTLEFRNETLLDDHFIKHGSEFGYKSKQEYVDGANEVVNSPSSKHKKEAEDGDDIYYDVDKNEIVFVSEDGYIRTYFKPSEGIKYYNKQ